MIDIKKLTEIEIRMENVVTKRAFPNLNNMKSLIFETITDEIEDELFEFKWHGSVFSSLLDEACELEKLIENRLPDFENEIDQIFEATEAEIPESKLEKIEQKLKTILLTVQAQAISELQESARSTFADEIRSELESIDIEGYELCDWEDNEITIKVDGKEYYTQASTSIELYDKESNMCIEEIEKKYNLNPDPDTELINKLKDTKKEYQELMQNLNTSDRVKCSLFMSSIDEMIKKEK